MVQTCAALLVAAIQRKLPSIDAKVKELIAKKIDDLRALPETTPETMRVHYQDVVRDFEAHFTGLLDGTTFAADQDDTLHGGARIANLFEYSFQVGPLQRSLWAAKTSLAFGGRAAVSVAVVPPCCFFFIKKDVRAGSFFFVRF